MVATGVQRVLCTKTVLKVLCSIALQTALTLKIYRVPASSPAIVASGVAVTLGENVVQAVSEALRYCTAHSVSEPPAVQAIFTELSVVLIALSDEGVGQLGFTLFR